MASRNNYLFTADQWSPTYRMAPLSDLSHWAEISPPAARPFTMELTATERAAPPASSDGAFDRRYSASADARVPARR